MKKFCKNRSSKIYGLYMYKGTRNVWIEVVISGEDLVKGLSRFGDYHGEDIQVNHQTRIDVGLEWCNVTVSTQREDIIRHLWSSCLRYGISRTITVVDRLILESCINDVQGLSILRDTSSNLESRSRVQDVIVNDGTGDLFPKFERLLVKRVNILPFLSP